MKKSAAILVVVLLATPAAAQTAIRGIELSAEDAGRVARQCDALNAREMRSLASNTPEEPLPGQIVSDAAGFWADTATGLDSALSRLGLDALTVRDCRRAGFY